MRTLLQARPAQQPHAIDLAPMLDFVVNLLVFFIITAVFVKQAGITVERPARTEEESGKASKSIVIDERGDISIDGKTIDLRSVRAHIEQFRAVDSQAGIVVVADRGAPTGTVVAVVDQVHLGGVWDVTFTTAKLAGEGGDKR
jgi:biopolymer transport protein ExbD